MQWLIQQGDLAIRLMNDDREDYEVMTRWLTDLRVLEFYEGRDNQFSLERVMREYSPSVLMAEGVTACILVLREIHSVGPTAHCFPRSPILNELRSPRLEQSPR